ncbi:hypothetical protein Tco_0596233 [Tanacetum coccineum]
MADWWCDPTGFRDPTGFLESFPTYRLHSTPPSLISGLWVFSSKDERYENNSYSLDDAGTRTMIYDKIKSAFSKMDIRYGLAQFWAPVTIGGKHLLSTSGQPFAVSHLYSSLEKYRRLCAENAYDIDVNSNNSKVRGTPASAFLNHFSERALSLHEECYSHTVIMMPICCPSQTCSSSDCIGVIECSSWLFNRVHLFNEMNMQIKEVGLSLYNVQDRIPYKTINGLKLARDQIQDALKIVCQSHHITLAQVWIASLDENHVHFSSSWEEAVVGQCKEAQTRRLLGLKLTGCIDEDSAINCRSFQYYHDACDLIPLQPGEELVSKTLQDYESRFCQYISHLGNYKLMRILPVHGISSLIICLRSIHTGDFNYVFEFLWNHHSFNPISLEEILLNIKRCLPSFKFASGTEIGDKLHVIEVDNSTDKEIKKFEIFQAKRLSPIPEALKDGKKQVAVDYIEPLDRNCKTAPVPVPQQVIEQQFGTSTTENFLAAESIFGNGDLMADRDDERLSEFLETLPNYILHKKPETEGALWVFCSEDEGSQKNLSSSQPFAVSDFGEALLEYRERCMGYVCNIDMRNKNKVIKDEIEQQGDRHPMTMISGSPTNAFLSRLPEVVLDTRIHREGSLMRYASDCGLWTSYTLPIGCPSQNYSSCIGVVECSSMSSINLDIVNTMNRALEVRMCSEP